MTMRAAPVESDAGPDALGVGVPTLPRILAIVRSVSMLAGSDLRGIGSAVGVPGCSVLLDGSGWCRR